MDLLFLWIKIDFYFLTSGGFKGGRTLQHLT